MKILLATLTLHDEPLGIMYLSTILKNHGHQVRGVMLERENVLDIIEEYDPALIGYSAMDCERTAILKLNAQLKQKHSRLFSIVGGPLATFSPEVINDPYIDAVCVGEGEEALLELVDALEQGNDITGIENIWAKVDGQVYKNDVRPLIQDLDSIPFPDRTLFARFKQGKLFNVITSRGCPYNCTYCHNKRYKELYDVAASHIKHRSVDNVIEELREINTRLAPAIFWFQEDHFFISVTALKQFADRYRAEIDKPFICSMRPEYLVNEERARILKEANCAAVFTGCEAGNDRIRRSVLKRNISKEQVIRAAETLRAFDIRFVFQNMVGIPTSSFEEDIETLELNIRCKPYYAWASICTPYPGTELYEIAQEAGCIGKGYLDNLYETYHFKSSLDLPHADKVNVLHKVFALVVEYPALLPLVQSPEFYRRADDERLKSLKRVFDAFKEHKYASLAEAGLSVPQAVTEFVDKLLGQA
jgi:anaerobic magnesium-protoporphyrin IX monomethyl ester cyclase